MRKEGEMKRKSMSIWERLTPRVTNNSINFRSFIHQEDDGEGHQADKKNREDLFYNVKEGRFSHFAFILRKRRGEVKKRCETLDKF